jgi:hypothetical protein
MDSRIAELIARGESHHTAAGTDVRCPVCNVAAGKFCRNEQGAVIVHSERVAAAALQNAALGRETTSDGTAL